MRTVIACSILMLLTGCATQLTSYAPTANQTVVYDQGIGAITWEGDGVVLTMYPTFSYQSPSDIPTFTLMVQNKTSRNIDFLPESIHAYLDDHDCHVYTLQERVGEIRSAAKRKQITLAVLGGLAAGAAAYGASHQTTTYSGYATNGYRSVWTSGTIQTYDPASGILAGAAVGAATGVGIHQIAKTPHNRLSRSPKRPPGTNVTARRCQGTFVTEETLPADPAPRGHAPPSAIAYPGVRRPVIARPSRTPISANPDVDAPVPIPVAGEPDVARCWSDADDFHVRCGWSDCHNPGPVITWRGSHNAAAEHAGRQNRRRSKNLDSVKPLHTISMLSTTN